MKLGFRAIFLTLVSAGAVVLTGCSGQSTAKSNLATMSAQSAAVTVNVGDSPNDRVAALEVTINSITLTSNSGGTVAVLTSPVTLELRRLSGTFRPISVTSVPAGTYTQARLQLAAASITVLDPASGQLVKKSLPVPNTPVSIKFASPLVLTVQAATVNLDFNLASSVTIDANGNITFTPVIVATVGMVNPDKENEHDAKDGELEEVIGAVTDISNPKFTIMRAP